MEDFGEFSGFQINWSKSSLFPLDPGVEQMVPPSSKLQVVHSFRYLGVIVQLPLNSNVTNNLCPIIAQLQQCTNQWMDLPLDLMDRVNSLKMIFLPKLLYVMVNVPCKIPKSLIKQTDSLCTGFLWNRRAAKLALEFLKLPSHLAGLAFPNLYIYYLASQLVVVHDRLHPSPYNACTYAEAAIASSLET